MIEDVQKVVAQAVKELFEVEIAPSVEVPDEQFGDVASNVAMQLTKKVGKNPREIAEQLAERLRSIQAFSEVTIAGPGFINIRFTNEYLWSQGNDYFVPGFSVEMPDIAGKDYVVEYACPNWFKDLHTGHLYQTIIGDALARMIERAGATVHRTSYGGDVGMHVAKALWSVLQDSKGYEAALANDDPPKRAEFITGHYVHGSSEFEKGGQPQKEIKELNKKIYTVHKDRELHPDVADVYFTVREWSTNYFHYFFDRIGVADFERYYAESEVADLGMKMVTNGIEDGVFTESEGAVIFEGEKEGLHTRVFVTKEGLPTYEAKDLGLIATEKQEFDYDHRILITGADQIAYMKVVWAAMNTIDSRYLPIMKHHTNGIVKFADGVKMSSRLGNVTRAIDVLDAVEEKIETQSTEKDKVVLGAIKYEFLKYHIGSDISFDINESVSTKGNSGPYMQYAYVRAKKVALSRTDSDAGDVDTSSLELDEYERRLARKLAQYGDVFSDAVRELAPNTVCLYLYELAQTFNQFYEKDRVAGSGRPVRWELVNRYINVLGHGLETLGIEVPESM